ncbi:MAG: HAD-IIA family hydrolase [Candidatus Acetothermia bacterium]|jgi:HAD superfamily hydrolase (TIGR01450 family)|nr:HAD-IIA family hydrolase [Candidatus Acetothermia bacterium]MDH7505342.1 HAD-IIA family hydrolase [Candidatus Acetothermia bacterium]
MGRPELGRYRAFLVDLDGVLIRGGQPLPGAVEALQRLRELGRVIVFSNNSTRSRRAFAARLQREGFAVAPEEVVNSAYILGRRLLELSGPSKVFMIGEEGLKEELELAGHRLVGPEEANFLVTGMDRELSYEKLLLALRALRRGARFFAANADPTYPTPEGEVPGAGAVVGAIQGMGFPPEEVVGKPAEVAFRVALEAAGVKDPRDCLVIGDRLETDVLGARRAGLESALVLTGVTSPDELEESPIRPTYVAESLAALVGVKPREGRSPRGGGGPSLPSPRRRSRSRR